MRGGGMLMIKFPEPFPGARPYDEEDRYFFFGREREITDVAARIFRERITILTGESAAGKTSLLRAGIIPLLWDERLRSEPGNGSAVESQTYQPRAGLTLVLRVWGGGRGPSAAALIKLQLPDAIEKLRSWSTNDYNLLLNCYQGMASTDDVVAVLSGLADVAGGLILVFDQFEEVLRARKSLARELIEIIRRLYQLGSRIRLLLSLREEYHKDLRVLESLVGPLYARTYFLKKMDPPTIEEAIHLAARAANVNLPKKVVRILLDWLDEAETGEEGAGSLGEGSRVSTVDDSPDLLRMQTVVRELIEYCYASQGRTEEVYVNEEVLEDYRGGRSLADVVGKALARWIINALKVPVPMREGFLSREIVEPEQTALVFRIAARVAPFFSSGDYKVAQEEADLFRNALREDLASLLGLEDRNLLQRIADAVRKSEDGFLCGLDLGPALVEGAKKNLAGAASGWSVETTLRELFLAFRETLERLHERNIVKPLYIANRAVWELVHDGFARPFRAWSEEDRETWNDCLSSLVACRGISPILIAASVDHCAINNLRWLGCLVKPIASVPAYRGPVKEEINLRGLRFESCDLRGTIFEGCRFVGVTFSRCFLDGTVFRNCRFLRGEQGEEVKFEYCDSNSIGFLDCKVESLLFDSCNLRQPTFSRPILAGPLTFTNSILNSAFFEQLCFRARGRVSFEGICKLQYCSWDWTFKDLVGERRPAILDQNPTSGSLEHSQVKTREIDSQRGALIEVLRNDRFGETPRRRATAGAILAQIGDPRPEVISVDGTEFCWVPAGAFWMGGEEPSERVRELPLHECLLPYDLWMGRYPVTVEQFAEFVAESGCYPGSPECLFGKANEPVAWVSWYEAMAFCEWLTRRWRSSGRLGDEWEVRLPSEAEWEKASRGGLEIPTDPLIRTAGDFSQGTKLKPNCKPVRRYPWGEEADPNRGNYCDTGIEAQSTVGCFALGASPYGCEEMSGNVWEWTRNLWGENVLEPSFRYPYSRDDGREELAASSQVYRVLRGGAFDDDSARLRCAFRVRFLPDERKSGIGFRIVVSQTT